MDADDQLPWLAYRAIDVQTAMDVLARRPEHSSEPRLFLARVDLRRMQLTESEAKLSNSNLRHSNLARSWLTGAHLEHSDMVDTDLRRAHLQRADLTEADLRGSCLQGADLPSMGSAAPRFGHPAACAARAIASMKPARGHPAPRLQAGHLAHDDAPDTTGEMCKGTPHSRRPAMMVASGWRQARPCPQGQPQPVKCLVNVHAKTGLTPSSGSRVWRRSGNGGGLAGPTGQATNRPVMPEQPDLFLHPMRRGTGSAQD